MSSQNPPLTSRSNLPSTQPTSNGPTRPPKSKIEPYYSISPLWTDVTPIPQIDGPEPTPENPDPGPALAAISYTPRYAEAMSYLRAVMADNEYTERCLALTEDIISMNPAHYTVWIYRMRILRGLWGLDVMDKKGVVVTDERFDVDEWVRRGVEEELKWLQGVSEKHLKNYQIWHHRQSLLILQQITSLPPTELSFLNHILTYDTKNYHVWSYRQWLCTRFPNPLLTTNIELINTQTMIDDDVRNNSAWNHRYFVVFGHKELSDLGVQGNRKEMLQNSSGDRRVVDLEIVEHELDFTKTYIRQAPQNGSSWNYLKGILKHANIPVGEMKEFCAEFVAPEYTFLPVPVSAAATHHPMDATVPTTTTAAATEDQHMFNDDNEDEEQEFISGPKGEDLINPGIKSSHAIEMLIDIFDKEGTETGREKVREGLLALTEYWDPIRRGFWDYKLKRLEEKWRREDE